MTAILPSQAIFAGSSPNVTCVVEFDDTVDIPLVIDFQFVVADGEIFKYDYPAHMESYRQYRQTFTISNIQTNQQYTCVSQPPSISGVSPMNILIHQMDLIITYFNISISK